MSLQPMSMDPSFAGQLFLQASPEAAPILGCALTLMYHAAEDKIDPRRCIDASMTIRAALRCFGIESYLSPTKVVISSHGRSTSYGASTDLWRDDGSFNGHAVLVVPTARRFLDATLQQFKEVPRSTHGLVPLIAMIPDGYELGEDHILIPRSDHDVTYIPLVEHEPELMARAAAFQDRYRDVGRNLAGNVFDQLRIPDVVQRTRRSPYPRLHQLLDALNGAETVVDGNGYRFRVPGSPRAQTIDEII
jgi:hypothetical protein